MIILHDKIWMISIIANHNNNPKIQVCSCTIFPWSCNSSSEPNNKREVGTVDQSALLFSKLCFLKSLLFSKHVKWEKKLCTGPSSSPLMYYSHKQQQTKQDLPNTSVWTPHTWSCSENTCCLSVRGFYHNIS